jgi:hypothetical protein
VRSAHSQIRVPDTRPEWAPPRYASQIRVPDTRPRYASQIRVPDTRPNLGVPTIRVPDTRPEWAGVWIRVPDTRPNYSLCEYMWVCEYFCEYCVHCIGLCEVCEYLWNVVIECCFDRGSVSVWSFCEFVNNFVISMWCMWFFGSFCDFCSPVVWIGVKKMNFVKVCENLWNFVKDLWILCEWLRNSMDFDGFGEFLKICGKTMKYREFVWVWIRAKLCEMFAKFCILSTLPHLGKIRVLGGVVLGGPKMRVFGVFLGVLGI